MHFHARTMLRRHREVEAAYPQAERIYLFQDNWKPHTAHESVEGLAVSKIELVLLPTYAPLTNSVEKVWRKLYQEVLHLHP